MKLLLFITSLLISFLLQGCSGNSFHLRKNIDLPLNYQQIQVDNLPNETKFVQIFEATLEESGGRLLEKASTKIKFENFREEKRIIAYTSKRKARQYLLSLKFDYTIVSVGKLLKPITSEKYRINLDRVFTYDANFALGKAEEETQIKESLYAEAARLILLRLQYSKN